MTSLNQTEIAQYLLDYASLNEHMINSQENSIKSLFEFYINSEDKDLNYFNNMINIYVLILKMKTYCLHEDYNLKNRNNFISNEVLNLDEIRKSIIKSEIGNKVSDKKLLQLIKDSYCHSTSEDEMIHISPDGKQMKININQDNINIDVVLTLNDIISLTTSISDNTQNIQLFGYKYNKEEKDIKIFLNNFIINRYHFTKKIDNNIIEEIYENADNNQYNNALEIADNIENCTVKEIKLTDEQIEEICNIINNLLEKNILTEKEFNENFLEVITILINKKFPLPIFKSDYYTIDSFVAYYLQTMDGFSYSSIYKIVSKLLPEKEKIENNIEDYFKRILNNTHDRMLFKTYYNDKIEKKVHPYMLFIEYIITNYCCENKFIEINDKEILSNKLRNSLVHARWCIDKDEIIFYDALPNVNNELDYNWQESINFNELCNYCKNVLEEKKQIRIDNKQYKKTIN